MPYTPRHQFSIGYNPYKILLIVYFLVSQFLSRDHNTFV